MFPLILIALALGAGLAAYTFSPKAHEWVDVHIAAIQQAIAAHQEAEGHMKTAAGAAASGDPVTAGHELAQANASNQKAAQDTATAAGTAKTPQQQQDAKASANQVVDREARIAEALAHLGVGACGVKTYPRVTQQVIDKLLAKLNASGMTVTGDNPWDVDAGAERLHVKLRAVWDPKAQVLKLIVTAAVKGLCATIWQQLDPIMKDVIG
jgi:hypothetical protein